MRRLIAVLTPTVVAAAVLTGCDGGESPSAPPSPTAAVSTASPVTLPGADPALSERDRAACAAFLSDVPPTLAQQDRVDVAGRRDSATWGDPGIQLRCGVAAPPGFDPSAVPGENDPSPCTKVSGVGWWVPPDQLDGDGDAVLTAVTYEPRIAVLVPQQYLPEGSAAALAELAADVKQHLRRSLHCG